MNPVRIALQRRQIRNFSTNVIANIVANLAVAGIVYLAGAALGIFPRTAGAITSAAFAVVMAIFFATAIAAGWRIRKGRGQLLIPVVVALFGVGFTLSGVAGLGQSTELPNWISIPFGILFTALGTSWIWGDYWRERTRQQRKARIQGIHWIELQ